MGSDLPERVTIVEVGPRDGLQNEKEAVSSPLQSSTAGRSCLRTGHIAKDLRAPVSADPYQHKSGANRQIG